MASTRSWVLRAIVVILLLGAGFAAGGYVGYRFAMGERWIAAVEQSHGASTYAYVQYREGEYEAAKAALLSFLAFLESTQSGAGDRDWHPGVQPSLDKRELAFDKMLTVARLALLEERQNGAAASEQWWVRAEGYARVAEWKDASRRRIRDIVKRLDRANDERRTQTDAPKQ